MKELLIIRSVSFQQLDLNLPAIKEKYKDYKISLLTHEHGVKLAEKYKDIDNIYVYKYKGSFEYGKEIKDIEGKEFDIVIVPVTNITGVGFFNVMKFSLGINSRKKVMCNVISELKEFTRRDIFIKELQSFIFRGISTIFSAVLSIFLTPFLIFKLKGLSKEK